MDSKKILVVDDEILILEKVTTLLALSFDNILTAENGAEALDVLAENEDVCCVITDINMPKLNGIEFIKAVRDKGSDIPFIIFTSYGDDQLMKEAIKYGVFDFIDKPLFSNLAESVSKGVSEGFKLQRGEASHDTDRTISEYEKLLSDLEE